MRRRHLETTILIAGLALTDAAITVSAAPATWSPAVAWHHAVSAWYGELARGDTRSGDPIPEFRIVVTAPRPRPPQDPCDDPAADRFLGHGPSRPDAIVDGYRDARWDDRERPVEFDLDDDRLQRDREDPDPLEGMEI